MNNISINDFNKQVLNNEDEFKNIFQKLINEEENPNKKMALAYTSLHDITEYGVAKGKFFELACKYFYSEPAHDKDHPFKYKIKSGIGFRGTNLQDPNYDIIVSDNHNVKIAVQCKTKLGVDSKIPATSADKFDLVNQSQTKNHIPLEQKRKPMPYKNFSETGYRVVKLFPEARYDFFICKGNRVIKYTCSIEDYRKIIVSNVLEYKNASKDAEKQGKKISINPYQKIKLNKDDYYIVDGKADILKFSGDYTERFKQICEEIIEDLDNDKLVSLLNKTDNSEKAKKYIEQETRLQQKKLNTKVANYKYAEKNLPNPFKYEFNLVDSASGKKSQKALKENILKRIKYLYGEEYKTIEDKVTILMTRDIKEIKLFIDSINYDKKISGDFKRKLKEKISSISEHKYFNY